MIFMCNYQVDRDKQSDGIVKLTGLAEGYRQSIISRRLQFISDIVPNRVSVCSGMAVRDGGEGMATRTENGLDLIVSCQELLGMARRFEPPEYLLAFSGRSM